MIGMKRSRDSAPRAFSLLRLLLGSLAVIAVSTGLFVLLTYVHLSQIDESLFLPCQGASEQQLQDCANRMIYIYFADARWLAILFTVQIIPATLIGYLFSRKGIEAPVLQAGMIAVLGAFSLYGMLQPGGLVAVSVFLGTLLGGLIASSRRAR